MPSLLSFWNNTTIPGDPTKLSPLPCRMSACSSCWEVRFRYYKPRCPFRLHTPEERTSQTTDHRSNSKRPIAPTSRDDQGEERIKLSTSLRVSNVNTSLLQQHLFIYLPLSSQAFLSFVDPDELTCPAMTSPVISFSQIVLTPPLQADAPMIPERGGGDGGSPRRLKTLPPPMPEPVDASKETSDAPTPSSPSRDASKPDRAPMNEAPYPPLRNAAAAPFGVIMAP